MLAIQVRTRSQRDEKLGAVRVRTGVCHGEQEGLRVFQHEVFVGKVFTVDRFSTRPVTLGEVASLDHEPWDYPMKLRSFVVKLFARHFANSCLAC